MLFKTRKFLVIILLLLVINISLTACGSKEASEISKTSTDQTQAAQTHDNAPTPSPSSTPDEVKPSPSPSVEPQQEADSSLQSYESPQFNMKLKYPGSWALQEGLMGTVAVFLSPNENDTDTFQESVNIIVQDLSTQTVDIDLAMYTEGSVEQIKQLITDASIITSEKATLSGKEAHKLVYTGKQGEYDLKWMQIYSIKDKMAYVISFTAQADKYDSYVKQAEELVNSIEIK
jgi:cytoskeletal protein RodZ